MQIYITTCLKARLPCQLVAGCRQQRRLCDTHCLFICFAPNSYGSKRISWRKRRSMQS